MSLKDIANKFGLTVTELSSITDYTRQGMYLQLKNKKREKDTEKYLNFVDVLDKVNEDMYKKDIDKANKDKQERDLIIKDLKSR